MTYVIFSIDNVTDTHTLAKFLRYFDTQEALSKTKGYLVPCIGSYKGEIEQSFICTKEDYLEFVIPYGATVRQESVLVVEADGDTSLCNYNLTGDFIGVMTSVSKKKAMKSEGWTYRPDLNSYWIIK